MLSLTEGTTDALPLRRESNNEASPLLPEIGVIQIAPDTWSERWMVRHHLAFQLGRYYHVMWLNPGMYWQRALITFRRSSVTEPYKQRPGFHVYTPGSLLPTCYRPSSVTQWLFTRRVKQASAALRARGCNKVVLFLWRPEYLPLLQSVPHHASFYHIEDEYSFSPAEKPIDEGEAKLIAAVNHVFILSPAMMEKKGQINPNTSYEPGGVDFAWYSQILPEPADLASIPHPRIGYTGHLKRQLDWKLLLQLCVRHKQWSFVFVGPKNPHPEIKSVLEKLEAQPNVYFLGAKTSLELAAYPQHFDLCIMPYVLDEYTRYVYPLKLHEYLASGTPIVGTPICSLKTYGNLMELPVGLEEWSKALQRALNTRVDVNTRKNRQAAAASFDWELVTERIARKMAEVLGHGYREYFDQIAYKPCLS